MAMNPYMDPDDLGPRKGLGSCQHEPLQQFRKSPNCCEGEEEKFEVVYLLVLRTLGHYSPPVERSAEEVRDQELLGSPVHGLPSTSGTILLLLVYNAWPIF